MGYRMIKNKPLEITNRVMVKNALFLLFVGLSLVLFYTPMKLLVKSSLNNELYSHIILIPLVSIYLMYNRRSEIFRESGTSVIHGGALIVAGVSLLLFGGRYVSGLDQNDFLSVMTFAAVLCCIGGFILFYGLESSRLALFLMMKVILLLQICFTEVSYGIFKLTGVLIFREGFRFSLPGVSVEVAKQCGGIRSSLVFYIVSILAGHLFLPSWKRKVILSLWVLPISIVKKCHPLKNN
jgi:exosortase